MGGAGSGRKPNADNVLNKRYAQFNTGQGEVLIMPNHSGISSHPEAIGNFLKLDTSNSPLTGDLTIETINNPIISSKATIANGAAIFRLENDAVTWDTKVDGGMSDKFIIRQSGIGDALTIDPTTLDINISNGVLDMNSHQINNVVDPTSAQDVATKNYVDTNDSDTTYTGGTNLTLAGTTFNVDDSFIKNDADDTSTGKITAANFAVTGDNTAVDTEYVPMVLFNTDATPPTASTFPKGTIYVQYTA